MPQKEKRGRRRKRRLFSETRVGHFLKYEAPMEYWLLESSYPGQKFFCPPADLIEKIGYSSINPLFKKPKFRRALIEYRQTGLYCGQPVSKSPKTIKYYQKIKQRNRLKEIKNFKEGL